MPVVIGTQGFTGQTQQTRLVLEPISGEQPLMPQTVVTSTMSLVTQPNTISPTTGMALHLYIIGNAAPGTMNFVGTGPTGSVVTSQTYHVKAAPQNNQGYTELTTTEVFATVGASGITTTLTGCQIIVFGSYGAKFLLPVTADAEEKITHYSSQDKRGILAKNFRVTQLTKGANLDKFDCDLYPDSLWMPYMLIGNTPTITTVPASPPSLLTATTKAATMTLTTAPSAPGMFLVFTIATNSVAGTIVLSGLDNFGASSTETITVSASQTTVYSSRRYSSLTVPGALQFATTGMSVGATITVSGVFGWNYTWTYDGVTNYTPYSATLEAYNGVFGYKLPYTFFSSGDFSWEKEKEIGFSAKGEAQDYLVVGDPTSTAAGTNPFAILAQPVSLPMVSWPGSFFIDLGSGTPLTTPDGSLLTFKTTIDTGRKPFHVGDGFQRWSNVTWDSEPDYSIDATLVLQNTQQYINYFKPNQSLLCGAVFQGNLLGTIGSQSYFENWTWTFPGKIDSDKNDASKSPVTGSLKIMSEYNFSQGFYYRLSVTTQTPPTYAQ
jgi:hypothetical protein